MANQVSALALGTPVTVTVLSSGRAATPGGEGGIRMAGNGLSSDSYRRALSLESRAMNMGSCLMPDKAK